MTYTEIGNTGIKIPKIIFGTSALGNLYTALPEDVKTEIVKNSVTHVQAPVVFDSAGKYGAGLALEKLGSILHKLGVSPNDVIISNKLGWKRVPLTTPEPSFEQGVWMDIENDAVQNISYDGIYECWEQGNALLGHGYNPQLLSVHDPDEYLNQATDDTHRKKLFNDILGAYKALGELKAQGKVKAIGVGAKNWRTIQQITQHVKLDWVMFANSLTIYDHPTELLTFMEQLHKQGVSIVNSAVFNGGFLTGSSFFNYQPVSPENAEHKKLFNWRDTFYAICKKHDVKPFVACVNFSFTAPFVSAIALNTSAPKRVADNVNAVNAEVPAAFYKDMIDGGLIDKKYPYLNF